MRLSKPSLAIIVPLAALAIAGCGGGGGDSTSTPTTTATTAALSKAELISQGDAICAEVNKAAGAAEIVSAGEASQLAAKVSGLYIGMVASIKALGTPEDAAGYPEFAAAADELSSAEGEVELAAEREDTVALEEASGSASSAVEAFESAAGEYGFEDCSEGPSAPTPSGTGTGVTEEAEEGGVEVAPEELEEEVVPEEVAPEEVAPETGGAGGGVEEAAPESGGSAGGTSGGVGPG
jgi:hypothetical protein